MRKFLLFVSAIGFLLVPLGVAQAKQSGTSASGSFTGCETVKHVTTEPGGVLFIQGTQIEHWPGTFSGRFFGSQLDVVYPDGSDYFSGVERFTGSVQIGSNAAKTGHFIMTYTGIADSTGSFHGHWYAGGGSQGLVGIHGRGTFTGQNLAPTGQCGIPYGGTYSGQIQFSG